MAALKIKLCIVFIATFYILLGSSAVHADTNKGEEVMTVSSGKTVSIEYTLKLDDKTVVDSNVGSDPLIFVQGSSQIIPGLEKEMEGLKIGDTRQVTVSPKEGYGEINEKAFAEVDKSRIPADAVKVGVTLQGKSSTGQAVYARVTEVKEKTVLLDYNHPLAGKTLHFDVKVLNIQAASAN
jgi:FKBP-type peptidyl-prolyl cis-trans isomerase SlyD